MKGVNLAAPILPAKRFSSTKKAESQPTRDVNRDSGTDSANGGSGDFHEKAVMSKDFSRWFLVEGRIVGKAGVDLASIRTRSRERFTIGSDVLVGGV